MRIRIELDQPLGPLSILRELPEGHLAVLEGLNGIGKTLAIRILQICSGTIPYRKDSPAWRSLCEGLGPFRVIITDLNGANEIVWAGDSRDWLNVSEVQTSARFRSIEIDGRTINDVREINKIFTVYRLAGDEGLIETFAQQADDEAAAVARWERRFTDQEDSPLAHLERQLGSAVEVMTEWSQERYVQMKLAVRRAEDEKSEAVELAEQQVKRRGDLEDASNLRRQIQQIERRTPDLENRLEALDSEILNVQVQRDEAQNELMLLAGQLAGADALLRELQNARRTRDRNRDRLADQLDIVGKVTSDLGIEPTPEAVAATLLEAQALLDTLTAEQVLMDAAPSMRRLLHELTGRLADAESSGLADQLAIDDSETDTQLTVAQTRSGMLTRRMQLEGQPPPPDARELIERIAEVRRRIELAQTASRAFNEADRFQRLAATNELRVDDALAALDSKSVERVEELLHQRRASDERMIQLAASRASLRQQLGTLGGGQSTESLSLRLLKITERHHINLEDIDSVLERASRDALRADERASSAGVQVVSAKREIARANAEIRRAVGALAEDSSLEWLRRGLGSSSPLTSASPELMLELIQLVRARLRAALQRLSALRTQLGGVRSSLTGIAEHIRARESGAREFAFDYTDNLESWLGIRFSSWFNVPRVRSELLPDADGEVSVNLRRREVVWSEGGAEFVRPIEAFSSGQQAFAYTRARLAILDDDERVSRNRLIALDEFGAFIAVDRLAGLMAYLTERAAEHPHDQVLVILPLTRDYSDQAASAVGREAARLEGLAGEIKHRGYAVQELVP